MVKVMRACARYAFPVALLLFSPATTYSQTTAFTYQGQLSDGGAVANGNYDLRFALFATAAGGAQIGAPQTVSTVPVNGGVFTVQLDFGVSAFPGANRFLEIGVKPAAGGSFTTLAPRQQISSSPYSIRTLSAATADALSSACVGCVQTAQINSVAGSKISGPIPAASLPTGSGNYIQNTTTPQANASFNISGNGIVGGTLFASKVAIAAQDGLNITGFQPVITLWDTSDAGKRALVSSGSGDLGFYTESAIGGNATVLIKNGSGNVGIGTTAPTLGKLQADGGSAYSGVYATTSGNQLNNQSGVYGGSSAVNGTGVTGEANTGIDAYGVWGKSVEGSGVYGEGPVGVYGRGTPSGDSFGVFCEGALHATGSVSAEDFLVSSDRNVKANFSNVEPAAILRRLVSMPIQNWNFRSQPATARHLGPMAQDFHAAFDLGVDDKHISILDANGVALAAIQGLYQMVEERDRQIQQLQQRVQQLERRVPSE